MKNLALLTLFFALHTAAPACMSCFLPQDDKLPSGGNMPLLFGGEAEQTPLEAKIEEGFLSAESSYRPRDGAKEMSSAKPEKPEPLTVISNQSLYADSGTTFRNPYAEEILMARFVYFDPQTNDQP